MKLLTPKQTAEVRGNEDALKVLRTQELNEAAKKARQNLANAEADFATALAGQRQRALREQQEHDAEVARREKELSELEKRREKALQPVALLKEEARKELEEAQSILEAAKSRETDAEELTEKLHDRLDEVGQRETDVLKRENESEARKRNLDHQEALLSENQRALVGRISAFGAYESSRMSELADIAKELTFRELSVQARTSTLDARGKELDSYKKRLDDRQATLERAFARIRTKKKS